MSQEVTVNRVEYHIPLPPHVGETVVGIPTEEIDLSQNETESKQSEYPPRVLPEDVLVFSELELFKKQVITAFKHFGLDTRKFFGE